MGHVVGGVELGLETERRLDGLAQGREKRRREGRVHAGDTRGRGSVDLHHGVGRGCRGHVDGGVGRKVRGGLLDNVLKHADAPAEVHVLGGEVGRGRLFHDGELGRGDRDHVGNRGGDARLNVLNVDVGGRRGDGGEVDTAAGADNLGWDTEVGSERDDRVCGGRLAGLAGSRGGGAARAQCTVLVLELDDTSFEPAEVGLALVAGPLRRLAVADCLEWV